MSILTQILTILSCICIHTHTCQTYFHTFVFVHKSNHVTLLCMLARTFCPCCYAFARCVHEASRRHSSGLHGSCTVAVASLAPLDASNFSVVIVNQGTAAATVPLQLSGGRVSQLPILRFAVLQR